MNYTPSIYSHTISGGFLLMGAIYLVMYFSKITKDPYHVLVLILLFSIAVGVHGLSHVALETAYDYTPASILKRIQSYLGNRE